MQTEMQISVSELRKNLSRYLHLASGGTSLIITRRRKPLTRLKHIVQTGDAMLEKILQVEGTDWNGSKPRLGAAVKPQVNGRSAADYVLD